MIQHSKALGEKKWHILCTKPRKENVVFDELKNRGAEAKLFVKTTSVYTSKGIRNVNKPLISGYLFLKISAQEIGNYQYIMGVTKFLKCSQKYEYLREEDIQLLEKLCDHDYEVSICDKLSVGTKIEITEGVLKGVQGKIQTNSNGSIYLESVLQSVNLVIKKENLKYKIIE